MDPASERFSIYYQGEYHFIQKPHKASSSAVTDLEVDIWETFTLC